MSDTDTEISTTEIASLLANPVMTQEKMPDTGPGKERDGDGEAEQEEETGDTAESDEEGGQQEDSGDDDSGEEEQERQEDDASEPTIEFEDDGGEKIKLTVSELRELRKSGLRQADYTKKTQELAEKDRHYADEMQKVQKAQEQWLGAVNEMIDHQRKSIDPYSPQEWAQMEQQEPDRFAREWAAVQRRAFQLQNVISQRDQVLQQVNQTKIAEKQKRVTQQDQFLAGRIPEWSDPEKKPQLQTQLSEYLTRVGYKPDEFADLDDGRAVEMIYKAMKYDNIQAKSKTIVEKKVVSAPKLIKPAGRSDSAKSSRIKDLDVRTRKTGSRDDLARYFSQIG